MTDNLIGHQIRLARKRKHLAQYQLAERLDIDPSHLSRIESGSRDPSHSLLTAIADELDVTFVIPGGSPADSALESDDPVEGLVMSLRHIMDLIQISLDRMEELQKGQREDMEMLNKLADKLLDA